MSDTITIPSSVVRDKLANPEYIQYTKELYYLAIYDLGKSKLLSNKVQLSIGPSSAAGDNVSPEYYFKLPPKVHEVTEPFATSVVLTQDGGNYIESQGSPLKEVRLTGTTGLRPHKNDSKTLKVFGFDTGITGAGLGAAEFLGVANSPDLFGTVKSVADVFTKPSPWPKGEALGYDDIIFLRNLFRLYAWQKVYASNASDIIMLWRNVKDADYWLVEPREFRLSQSSSSPLTYEYSITLNTIAKYDYKVTMKPDPMQFLRDARNLYSRVNQSVAVLRQSFLFLAAQIDRFARLPRNLADFILSPMVAVIEGAAAVKRSSKRFSDVFSSSMQQLRDNLKVYLGLVNNSFPPQSEEVNALRKALSATELLLADPEINSSNINNVAVDNKRSVDDAYGSNSSLASQSLGNSMAKDIVQVGDDIKSLAYRLLGDRTKYQVLVVCNSLTAPYITSSGGLGILKPGDEILYPITSQVTNTGLISSTKRTSRESNSITLTSIDQQLGRDLQVEVKEVGVLGDLSDLVINQTGDIGTVVGVDNIKQAIKVKFSVQRGELPAHTNFGALYPMGTKATPASLSGFRLGVEQTLLSDSRISSIKDLSFTVIGDTLAAQAAVVLASSASSLRLSFPIRKI